MKITNVHHALKNLPLFLAIQPTRLKSPYWCARAVYWCNSGMVVFLLCNAPMLGSRKRLIPYCVGWADEDRPAFANI